MKCGHCDKGIPAGRKFCCHKCYLDSRGTPDPAYMKKWRDRNREKVRRMNRESYHRNKETRLASCVRYRKHRYQTDPGANIHYRLRSRVSETLKIGGSKKFWKFNELVGCTQAELLRHIESTFKDGISWANRDAWHIDHKIPCSKFDLSDPEQQKQCFHYTNLQAMWAGDNIRKGSKLPA